MSKVGFNILNREKALTKVSAFFINKLCYSRHNKNKKEIIL